MESKKTFILKSSWIEVFSQLSDKQAGKLIKSLYSYNVNGDLPAQLDDMEVKAYFNMMKLECDEFLKNYDKRSVTSAVNGRKGGRPKKPNNLTKNLISYQKPKDKDNDKDNDIKKESPNGDKKEADASSCSQTNSDYQKFQDWLGKHAPYCSNVKNFPSQITETEFIRLKAKYTAKEIAETIEQIENRKDLRKRYTNLYRTVLNWLKRENGS